MQVPKLGITIGLATIAAIVGANMTTADDVSSPPVTFMGTLAEWQYPDSQMPGGGSLSDGGNSSAPSAKFQAVLTTSDSVDKVIEFYAKKCGVKAVDGEGAANALTAALPRSVATQDDSQGRSVTLKVFVVNAAMTSTTLVISRVEGESQTHIAWSHYLRFDVMR